MSRTRSSLAILITVTVAAALPVACFGPFPTQPKDPKSKGASKGSGSGASGGDATGSGADKGKATAKAKGAAIPGPTDGFLAGAHILISYKGAKRAKGDVTRTQAQAKALASKLAAQLGGKSTRAKFAALAREHSDGPSKVQGGDLGVWKQGRMVPAFDRAILKLPYGGVTKAPVQTPFGYHVIMRHEVLPEAKLYAAHVLIAHAGALRAPSSVTRDKAASRALCQKIAKQAAGADLAAFKKLVQAHSDARDKARGGILGVWSTRSPGMPRAVTRAVRALEVGKVSGPVSSPFGCHVFLRLPLPPMYAGSHILIAYDGARRAKATVTRSKDEARALAQKLIKQLSQVRASQRAERFAELAKKHSDGPSAARGGKLGTWPKGRMVPAFDAAIERTAVGAVHAKPVETPFGFHVILRSAPAK